MSLDNLRKMGGKHGYRIHHRIAIQLRLLTGGLRNPQGRQPEGRLYSLNALNFLKDST